MALFDDPVDIVAFFFAMFVLLLNSQQSLEVALRIGVEEEADDSLHLIRQDVQPPVHNSARLMQVVLHNFRLSNILNLLEEDLGFWVKPRSTTWFSQFLIEQYDDVRWVKLFRFTKPAVFALADLLSPEIKKKDTHYRLAVPVVVRLACTLFKLANGASLFLCSELFAVGKSTVSVILRQTVHSINTHLRQEIMWPEGQNLLDTQEAFKRLCGLPAVVGAIDGTHVHIAKPTHGPEDYFYFKSGAYTMNCQAVVDTRKRFLDLFLGMPGSTHDARVLRRSSLYRLGMYNNLFDARYSMEGFRPYLIGDTGYPLLPWLMVPHKGPRNCTVLESLFNKKLRKGRCVVENAFGILKQSFRELLVKSELRVTFIPDVILCCAILHNILMGQSHAEVEQLMQMLRDDGLHGEVLDDDVLPVDANLNAENPEGAVEGAQLRTDLALYLGIQRGM